ncbi:hypothetical protein V8E54_005682 [Elaphomyces granulatus]
MLFSTFLSLLSACAFFHLHKVTAQQAAYKAVLQAGLLTTYCNPNTPCNQNGCQGVNKNNPNTSTGICEAGPCFGQVCASICGKTSGPCTNCGGCPSQKPPCDTCNGVSSSHGDGQCGPGDYFGCPCTSTCGSSIGSCWDNGCNGINSANSSFNGFCTQGKYTGCEYFGIPGFCTDGQYWGCPCKSTCGLDVGACNQNGCNGVNVPRGSQGNVQLGFCTAGEYWGCKCKSVCGTSNYPCNQNGCNGINAPDGKSAGLCTAGDFNGCLCNSICSKWYRGPCSECEGSNGICTSGDYTGCYCNQNSLGTPTPGTPAASPATSPAASPSTPAASPSTPAASPSGV